MMVDIFESLISNMSGDITNLITKDLIMLMKENNNKITNLNNDLNNIKNNMIDLNKDVLNNITIKLFDIKKEYMDDLNKLIENKDNKNLLNIIDRIEKENIKLINEIVPKTNNQYYMHYENLIKCFKSEINNINQTEIFETKYNNLLKNIELSLINHITGLEDRTTVKLNEINNHNLNQSSNQLKINEELMKYLDKYKNSSYKGQISENHIENILNNIYKNAEIKRTSDESKSGDFIMYREDKPTILFEIKNYNKNVNNEEVNKFIRDINNKNICGIMLSINTGICNKYNYQIDIENNNICLYIHDMNYDNDKLKIGVDIIDNLYKKINIKENNKNIYIDENTLNLINKEYQLFISKRELVINNIKDTTKHMIQYIDELEFPNLNKYLLSKFEYKNTSNLECDICKNFIGKNLKSLAVHKRKCKKNNIIEEQLNISDENNSTDN